MVTSSSVSSLAAKGFELMFGDKSASLQVEVLKLDVGQVWRSQGTATGHKNGLQT